MYDPTSLQKNSTIRYPVAYVGTDSDLRDLMASDRGLRVYDMELAPALQSLKERKLAAVVYVPDTKPDAVDPVKITLYTIKNDIQAAVVDVKLKDSFVKYEAALRQIRADRIEEEPIPLDIPKSNGGSDYYEFVYGLLIPLLVIMPAIISSALVIDLITEEYQNNTLETLLSTPIRANEIFWGKVMAALVLVPVQAGVWLFLLMLNGITIVNAPQILIYVTIVALVLILVASVTALYYRERTAAQFVYSTAIVVLMLFSLALPQNPMNLIAKLSTGSAGMEQWLVLSLIIAVVMILSVLTNRYAAKSLRANQAPR
jgi:ABC-2 type transport system permease protein